MKWRVLILELEARLNADVPALLLDQLGTLVGSVEIVETWLFCYGSHATALTPDGTSSPRHSVK
jgi:hypothetical protein